MRHLALWLISTLTLSCTQLSLKTLQNHPAPRHPAMQARQDTTVAIGEFIDARPTFTLSNAQSRRINESGPTAASIYQKALYGVDGDELLMLTLQEEPFVAVSLALQGLVHQELTQHQPTIKVEGQDLESLLRNARAANAEYLLLGEVTRFSLTTNRAPKRPGLIALQTTATLLQAHQSAKENKPSLRLLQPSRQTKEEMVWVHYEAGFTLYLVSVQEQEVVWSAHYHDSQDRPSPAIVETPLFQDLLAPLLEQATQEASTIIVSRKSRS